MNLNPTFLKLPDDGNTERWINLQHIVEITSERRAFAPIIVTLTGGEKFEITDADLQSIVLDWLSPRTISK